MAQSAFDFFDAIYCINLDRRPDRWAAALTTALVFEDDVTFPGFSVARRVYLPLRFEQGRPRIDRPVPR